ncbi:membrane protein [Mycobacterium phage Zaka]|uniref:Uncharacterized protein n=3 Tax=Gladiatorvirus TaxID=2948726 RepID=V5R5Y7_9CAUD|nr:membrane protein [Mycobacterium phage Artemis2UCLA]YP_008859192.1 membrane protein [Mycobacterium phage Zaka]AHB29977.1 hypothetical protein ARTEMIS2UCLA_84 [Mycobacterium phage Artemis2UCLA]AHB30080.1 hypothetical protein ZAKA_85 [Mycobacterium phage Zaka]ANT42272.1 hypothetical protein SEA_TONETONE_82 [Mycobacterium phage ToneTone]
MQVSRIGSCRLEPPMTAGMWDLALALAIYFVFAVIVGSIFYFL